LGVLEVALGQLGSGGVVGLGGESDAVIGAFELLERGLVDPGKQ